MSQRPSNRKSSSQGLVSKQEKNLSQGESSNNASTNSANNSASSAEQILREMQEEISPEATPLWQFVNDNAPKIASIVVSLVIIISAYAFYQGYQESALEDAKIQLSVITSTPDATERLSLLEAYKNEAPIELLVAIELEIAQISMGLGDFAKAESAFSYVKQEEGNTPLGVSAAMNIGDIFARQGEAQKAIDMYESILEEVPLELRVTVYLNIAEAAADANMKEKALSAYKEALNTLPKDGTNPEEIEYLNTRIMQLS